MRASALTKLTEEIREHRESVDQQIEKLTKERDLYRTLAYLGLRSLVGPTRKNADGTIPEQGISFFLRDKDISAFKYAEKLPAGPGIDIEYERNNSRRGYEIVVVGPNVVADGGFVPEPAFLLEEGVAIPMTVCLAASYSYPNK